MYGCLAKTRATARIRKLRMCGPGLGFRVQGVRFRVSVSGFGFLVSGFGFRVQGLEFGVWCVGVRLGVFGVRWLQLVWSLVVGAHG